MSYPSPRMTLVADGERFAGRIFHACAGNSEYAGGRTMRVSPGALPDDGMLNIGIVNSLNRLEPCAVSPACWTAPISTVPPRAIHRRIALVDSDPPVVIGIDGDLFGETPAGIHRQARDLARGGVGQGQ